MDNLVGGNIGRSTGVSGSGMSGSGVMSDFSAQGQSVESDVFATIARINSGIDSLSKMLSPVWIDRQTEGLKENTEATRLSSELHNIEDRIVVILNSIRL